MVTLSRTIFGFLSFSGLLAFATTVALLLADAVGAGAAAAFWGAVVLAVAATVGAEGAFARVADFRGVVFFATVLLGLAGFAATGAVVWLVMVVSFRGRE